MTFTSKEIEQEKISVDYNDEWQYDDSDKTVTVKFFGFEKWVRRFFNLEDDYGNDWIDCYAIIDPIKEVVREIYMLFVSNCDDVQNKELEIIITNYCEERELFDALIENDQQFGGFKRFINNAKEYYKECDSNEKR